MDENKKSKKTQIWIGVFFAVSALLHLYFINVSYRMEGIGSSKTVHEEYSWKWISVACQGQAPELAFGLYEEGNARPEHVIRAVDLLLERFDLIPGQSVDVGMLSIGYIAEWDYGTLIVRSVADLTIHESWIFSEEELETCLFDLNVESARSI